MNKTIHKSVFLLVFSLISIFISAQGFDRPNGFSGQLLLIDHASFQDGAETGIGELTSGFEFAYSRFLNKYISVRVPFKGGLSKTGELDFARNRSFYGVDVTVQATLFGDESLAAPFVYAGFGGTKEESVDLYTQIPVGGGVNIRIGQWGFFQVKAEYRSDLNTDIVRKNMQYGLGLVAVVGPTKTTKEIEKMLSDTDGDGIDDDKDKCPDIAGRKQFGGCLDSDNDGIGDADDSCPDAIGLKALNGCPDSDMDGVADIVDNCPNLAGTADGCPDADSDGVADSSDKCPDLPGGKDTSGCPEDPNNDKVDDAVVAVDDQMTEKGDKKMMLDSDGDNFTDEEDDCPDLAGPANGCPDKDGDGTADMFDACPDESGVLAGCPDSDSDGIADYKDTCPSVAGSALNFGCPEVTSDAASSSTNTITNNGNFYNPNPTNSDFVLERAYKLMEDATRTVQFKVLSDDLTSSSYNALNQVTQLMIANPKYRMKVSGHTDNRGEDSVNQRLSEKRARTCIRYLRDRGVPEVQMSYMGYGARVPIADNDTEFGRSQNRRVEFELFVVD